MKHAIVFVGITVIADM